MEPAAIAAQLKALKDSAAAQKDEAAKLRAEADQLDRKAPGLAAGHRRPVQAPHRARGDSGHACAGSGGWRHDGRPPRRQTGDDGCGPPEEKKDFVNYDEHVKPILQAKCFRCHNDDTKKGGLSLTSHASGMAGGGSGPVVNAGDPDGSRLLKRDHAHGRAGACRPRATSCRTTRSRHPPLDRRTARCRMPPRRPSP
jgi:hypothetical protein